MRIDRDIPKSQWDDLYRVASRRIFLRIFSYLRKSKSERHGRTPTRYLIDIVCIIILVSCSDSFHFYRHAAIHGHRIISEDYEISFPCSHSCSSQTTIMTAHCHWIHCLPLLPRLPRHLPPPIPQSLSCTPPLPVPHRPSSWLPLFYFITLDVILFDELAESSNWRVIGCCLQD